MAPFLFISSLPLSEKGCQYKLRVYPSSEMEARFTTSVYAALRHLEGANRSIVEASKKQLEHFASMSHEIRYVKQQHTI